MMTCDDFWYFTFIFDLYFSMFDKNKANVEKYLEVNIVIYIVYIQYSNTLYKIHTEAFYPFIFIIRPVMYP